MATSTTVEAAKYQLPAGRLPNSAYDQPVKAKSGAGHGQRGHQPQAEVTGGERVNQAVVQRVGAPVPARGPI